MGSEVLPGGRLENQFEALGRREVVQGVVSDARAWVAERGQG